MYTSIQSLLLGTCCASQLSYAILVSQAGQARNKAAAAEKDKEVLPPTSSFKVLNYSSSLTGMLAYLSCNKEHVSTVQLALQANKACPTNADTNVIHQPHLQLDSLLCLGAQCLLVLQAAASDGWNAGTAAGSSGGPDLAIGTRWQTEGSQAITDIKRGIKDATTTENVQTVTPPLPSSSKASYSATIAACWHASAALLEHVDQA